MRSISTLVIYFTIGFLQILVGQPEIEKGYFMFPIKPGQVNYLTGSMGELRANHFHAGIDIKTGFQIGLPVYCSADGYVSRIKISSYGYGKVLYVTHPNGLTTVYAHLDKFKDSIASWTINKQYELQSFDIDVNLAKNELPVKKGQVIALSGNTGSSGGPHLHYEIRDEQEKVWNPLLFGFKEIKDTEPPIIDLVALRSFGINARIANEFGRKDFKLVQTGKNFIVPEPIPASGEIGIELKAHDQMNDMKNHYGISCIEVKVNGKETFFHNINSFSFEDGKKINAHIDYETLLTRNQRFQRCYVADGNNLDSYKKTPQSGRLFVVPGQQYKIEITVYDALSNNSTLTFTINGKESNTSIASTEISKGGYRIFENILKVKSKTAKDTVATFCFKGIKTFVKPAYLVNGFPVYLYDMRNGLIDSIIMARHYTERLNFVSIVPPCKEVTLKLDNFQLEFSDSALIDTLYLQMSHLKDPKGRQVLSIPESFVPVFGGINISYTPDKNEMLSFNSYIALNGRKYEDSKLIDNKLFAKTKYLGKFVVVKDTVPPSVKYVSNTSKSIKFNIADTDSGIESFRATIDGNWVMMNYEHKHKMIWSENLDKTKLLKGKFVLEVKDKAGNIKTYEKTL
jgi:hypothetical protein